MPESILFNQKDGIVEVCSSGDITIGELAKTSREAERYFAKNKVRGIFVDARGVLSMPRSVSLFDFVDSLLKSAIPRGTKFSVLMTQKEGDVRREVRFIETVGKNRGLLFRIFDDELQARRWLTDSS
jgi:hypothetical protein